MLFSSKDVFRWEKIFWQLPPEGGGENRDPSAFNLPSSLLSSLPVNTATQSTEFVSWPCEECGPASLFLSRTTASSIRKAAHQGSLQASWVSLLRVRVCVCEMLLEFGCESYQKLDYRFTEMLGFKKKKKKQAEKDSLDPLCLCVSSVLWPYLDSFKINRWVRNSVYVVSGGGGWGC